MLAPVSWRDQQEEGMVQTQLLKPFRAHDGCSSSHSGDGEDVRTVGIDDSTRDTRVRACVCMCARVLKHACVTDVEGPSRLSPAWVGICGMYL